MKNKAVNQQQIKAQHNQSMEAVTDTRENIKVALWVVGIFTFLMALFNLKDIEFVIGAGVVMFVLIAIGIAVQGKNSNDKDDNLRKMFDDLNRDLYEDNLCLNPKFNSLNCNVFHTNID